MTEPSELVGLAGRLQEAAARLKEQDAAADDEAPAPEALGVLARLEEAGAAVRDARRRLLELESRLRAS